MNSFDERERAAEARYVHQQEAQLEARLKRIFRVGRWAAELMKLPEADKERYHDMLYRLTISGAGDDLIVDRVRDDLAAAGVTVSGGRIRGVLEAEADSTG